MTVTLTRAPGSAYRELWKVAAADPTMAVSFLRPGGRGRHFPDTIAELLHASGRIQPSIAKTTRAVTRGDIGRLQVGLARSRRDIVILNADQLSGPDAELLRLCVQRASVNLTLVADEGVAPDVAHLVTPHGCVSPPDELLEAWQTRPGAGRRADTWDCQAALAPTSGDKAGCQDHKDALECVLAWFPHALVKGTATPLTVRVRLHELLAQSTQYALRVWPHARDIYNGARLAATLVELPAKAYQYAKVLDLAVDASTLTYGGITYPIPMEVRPIFEVARADKQADGFNANASLLLPRQGRIAQFRTPKRSAAQPPGSFAAASTPWQTR